MCTFYTLPPPALQQVPRGHVWLQGDNLLLSRDSREYGPVPLALLRGRVIAQACAASAAAAAAVHD
jgi:Signal peptidase, peptidase S26